MLIITLFLVINTPLFNISILSFEGRISADFFSRIQHVELTQVQLSVCLITHYVLPPSCGIRPPTPQRTGTTLGIHHALTYTFSLLLACPQLSGKQCSKEKESLSSSDHGALLIALVSFCHGDEMSEVKQARLCGSQAVVRLNVSGEPLLGNS